MHLKISKEVFYERGGLLDNLLDSSFDQALIVDKNKRIIFFSESSRRFSGMDPDLAVGKLIDELVPNTGFENVLKTGESDRGILAKLDGNLGIATHIPCFDGTELLGAIGIVYFSNIATLKKLITEHSLDAITSDVYQSISRQANAYTFKDYIGDSSVAKDLIERTKRAAASNLPILFIGETGTGKEILANAVHNYNKSTFTHPFIKINCSAIPNELLESELFGYEKGAFTGASATKKGKFELANNGSILLDEIGDMGFDMQTKLLRVLEEKEFERVGGTRLLPTNARVIASTNADLIDLSAQKRFREDLYYRLNTLEITVPSLRERIEDLPLLIDYFIKRSNLDIRFSKAAMEVMMRYDWPGNVRQLRNIINRFSVLNLGETIETKDVEEVIYKSSATKTSSDITLGNRDATQQNQISTANRIPNAYSTTFTTQQTHSETQTMEDMERQLILQALAAHGDNRTKAAESLSISRSTLIRKLKKFAL